jgi:hypothetical protein
MQYLEDYKKILLPVLNRYLVKRAAIFGSFAKDNAKNDSDLDLLIEPEAGFTIFKMLQLEEEIAALIDRKVDIVEYQALKPSIRNEVLASSVNIL